MTAPTIHGVVETAIYVDDLARAIHFYTAILKLEKQMADDRFCALTVAPGQVFLIFRRGETSLGSQTSGGFIPGHDGNGPMHFAFGIAAPQFDGWREHLTNSGVTIESIVEWPRGSRSLFFRDPDQHLVELVTPGAWTNY